MGEVHRLIDTHGRQGALQFEIGRRVVEVAAGYLADEDVGMGCYYSGWAQATLPHKRLANDEIWQVRTDRVSLTVEPGRRALPGGGAEWIGVPYGSRARLILLYLQTEAVRTQSREIELGKSLRAWLGKMGISSGGKSIADVREQAERIARCRLSFEITAKGRSALVQQLIVDKALFTEGEDSGDRQFLERTKLSESFYEQLLAHPVPIEEAAIRHINRHSLALDIYCWLAYRLHSLSRETAISWRALHAQFGAGVRHLFHFKQTFVDQLEIALAVYPAAKVAVTDHGLSLTPSRPPIAQRRTGLATSA